MSRSQQRIIIGRAYSLAVSVLCSKYIQEGSLEEHEKRVKDLVGLIETEISGGKLSPKTQLLYVLAERVGVFEPVRGSNMPVPLLPGYRRVEARELGEFVMYSEQELPAIQQEFQFYLSQIEEGDIFVVSDNFLFLEDIRMGLLTATFIEAYKIPSIVNRRMQAEGLVRLAGKLHGCAEETARYLEYH